MKPYIHFGLEEFQQRQQRVREELAKRGHDGMLLFKIEDMYWLCGLDTDGFTIFHNMFIGVDGELTHVSRSADLASIKHSSICEDIRLWVDSHDNPPVNAIRDMLESHGMRGKRIGVQYDTYGLTARLSKQLEAALDGFCELVDTSDLIRLIRNSILHVCVYNSSIKTINFIQSKTNTDVFFHRDFIITKSNCISHR